MSELFLKYLALHRKLNAMINDGTDDSDEGDQVRFALNDVLGEMRDGSDPVNDLKEVDALHEVVNTTGEYSERYA